MVHAAFGFADVGETYAEGFEFSEFVRCELARRETERVQRWPEFVAWMRVVSAIERSARASGGADENEARVWE